MSGRSAKLSRRSFLTYSLRAAGGLGALALAGCQVPALMSQSPAPAAGKIAQIIVQHQWVLDAALAGMYYAQEQALYRNAGLDVKFLPGGPGVDPVNSVTSGQALVGIHTNAASVLLPRANGLPIKVIASQFQKAPLGFLAKASSGIKKVEDLRQRRIGSVQTSLSTVEAVLKLNGLEGQAETVVVSPANSMQVLLNDQIDVLVGFKGNQGVQLELQGIPIVFFNFADLGYRQEGYPLFVTEQALVQNRDLLKGFLAATRQGWDYILQHPDAGAQLTVEKYQEAGKMDAALGLVKASGELMQSDVTQQHGLFYMNQATWDDTNRLLVDTKLLPKPVNLGDLLTWELLG